MSMPPPLPGLLDAAARIRAGTLSPVDLLDRCLERIRLHDDRLHAFITLTPETARVAAERAQGEIRRGHWRGPLHGIPLAYKDILWTAGVRTTAHSRVLSGWTPAENAAVVDRLSLAGAVMLGKTALHEFAYGNPVPDEPFPAARNPWNTEHAPGSSSSGSGAAVAGGLCLGAIGTDTGGSIRHPAAVCGIVGMKPTYGRVSNFGVVPLAASLDHVGPMTRTVRDNAAMLQAIAGHDARDPASAPVPVPDFLGEIDAGVRDLTIGVPRAWQATVPHDPEVLEAFERSLAVLRSLGARVIDIVVDGLADAEEAGTVILQHEAWQFHRENLARVPERYGASARTRCSRGAGFSVAQLQAANLARDRLRAGYAAVFAQGVHAIVSTGKEGVAATMASLYAEPDGRSPATNRMYNLTGMPALAVPMGFSAAGLPVGLQFAGPHWSEPLLYRIAAAFEDATRHHERWPAP